MRIAHQSESNSIWRRGLVTLLAIILMTPLGLLRAQEPVGPAEVSAANVHSSDGALLVELSLSRPAGVRSFSLASPDRLVFDIENATLGLTSDAPTSWDAPLAGVKSLKMSQFSVQPPVVRVVAEITDLSLAVDREISTDGVKLAVFKGESPFTKSGPGAPPEQLTPTIEKFEHTALDDGRDQFTVQFTFGVVLPQIRPESPTVFLLKFPGTDILLPDSSPSNFATGVTGNLVDRMRAERVEKDGKINTEIRLTVRDTSAVGYTLETANKNTLELVLFIENKPSVPASPIPSTQPVVKPSESSQIMVLGSTDTPPGPSTAKTQISKVQFQSISSDTDRFFIFYKGGQLEPRVQRFNYPTRIIFYFQDASVLLPSTAGDRYQTKVAGAVSNQLKVLNRVIEDVGPESQFTFYFPNIPQENVGFTLDYASDGELHIDFYRTSTPVNVKSSVEVNNSVPETQPAPPEIVEPAPAAEVPAPVVEKPAPIVEAAPAPAPVPVKEPAPAIVEAPAPVAAPALPLISVTGGSATQNTYTFHITTTGDLPKPEWVEYKYPDRIGLRFPLADVQLLDAKPGVYSSYTHIKTIPLVRAIVKDRGDDESTTITWTLEGTLAEFTKDLKWNGNEMYVTFMYTPIPVVPEEVVVPPAPEVESVEPEAAVVQPEPAKPAEEIKPIEEPVAPVVEEPAPVPEQVVEPAPVPEKVEETVVVPVKPETTINLEPAPAPVVTALPLLTLTSGENTDNTIVFNIATSEPLAKPEWVEYRYPDRIGLKFPISDVKLLGADVNALTVGTHVPNMPMVRAIVKDRSNEKSTTITWTLKGKLEEYTRDIQWDGTSMMVTFHYTPIVLPAPEQPVVVPEIVPAPVAVPETPEAVPTEPVKVNAEVEVYGEDQAPAAVAPKVEEPAATVVNEEKPAEPVAVTPKAAEPEKVESEPVKPAEPAPAPRQEMMAPKPVMVEESKAAKESEAESTMKAFEGVTITEVTFEKVGNADILRLKTDKPIENPVIRPTSYPTKLLITLPNSRSARENGEMQRLSQKVVGNWVDEYTMSSIVSDDSSDTTFSVYSHKVASPETLNFDTRSNANEWVLAVYERGSESPLKNGAMLPSAMKPAPVMPGSTEGPGLKPLPVIGEGGVGAPKVNVTGGENGPKISMRLEDANIRDVLQLIAEQAGLSISVGPSVQGKVTITLTDIGLMDLLDLLGAQLNFSYIIRSGVYIFGESTVLQTQFGGWPRLYISLSYADPDQVRTVLTSMRILSNEQITIYRGDTSATSTNIAPSQVIIQGEKRDLERAFRVISTLDQPPVMVQVDFQVLNTSETDNKNAGIQFKPGTAGYTGGINLLFTEQPSENTDLGPFPQGFDRVRSNTNIYDVQVIINYLLEKGYAELQNRASLTCANNQTGSFFVGQNIPYRSTFQVSELGRVTQRIATQSVGLTLDVKPHANPDGTVTMVLRPQNSNLLELTDIGPRTVDQRFTTTVRVKDGEPFIVGGFVQNEKRVKYDRFPFLSELPLLGNLFRNREVTNARGELIFVFTPHIIYPTSHMPEVKTDNDFQFTIPGETTEGY
jgi:type II secretory pathway component GspD/PulD (secretin)